MRQSTCGEIRSSILGFGCGSVLGRVGRSASLRAMNHAWDAGITFYDTARSYGYGEAESVLGEFLRGRREQAMVATKFGIAPQRLNPVKRVAVAAARTALRAPGVRRVLVRGGDRKSGVGEFTVAGLRESLETSLRQLRTDRVDLLFLHEATAAVIHQQDLMEELSALVRAGKVLRFGLYAATDVIADGIANGPPTLTAMQFGANAFDPAAAGFVKRPQRDIFMVANHPFGGEQRVRRYRETLVEIAEDEGVPAELREKLRASDWQVVLEAILGTIVDGTGVDALVFSMMKPEHLSANVQAVENNRFGTADLALIRARMLHSPAKGQAVN